MKFKKSVLVQMIREELAKHAKRLLEAGHKGPSLTDAHEDKKDEKGDEGDKKKVKPQKDPDNVAGKPKTAPKGDPTTDKPKLDKQADAKPPAQPIEAEPADAELDKDASGDEPEEDAAEVTGGKIAAELTGKTVQSITMEPKSKIMPGAQEVVITFNETPDPLRILIGKSGNTKFFWRGLHNEL